MEADDSLSLPKEFWWANLTQFGSALNDIIFKFITIYALIAWHGADKSAQVISSVGIALALPIILLFPLGGAVADHFSKRWVIVSLKVCEILIRCFALIALAIRNVPMVYLSVLMVASHNAFFTPCKFAIIPELVETHRLSRANGQVQLFTFLALLAGTLLAPRLSLALDGEYHIVLVFCALIAVFNLFAALLIGRTPAHPDRIVRINGARMLARAFRGMLNDQSLLGTVLAISFFSLIAIYCQMNMITYGDEHLGIGPEASTYLFLIAAVGIGIGSVLTGILSGKSILLAFIPGGAFFMLASLLTLGMLPDGSLSGVLVCMLVFGLGAGAYIVPLEAFLQFRSPADRIGSIKAANGILNWIGILIASGLVHLNSTVLKLPARTGFLMLSLLLFVLLVSNFWLHSIQKPIIQSQS